jgi:hypothetical protein
MNSDPLRARTFVVYERATGRIVQTHVQLGDEHGDPGELLQVLRPDAGDAFALLEAAPPHPGVACRVDPVAGAVVPGDGGGRPDGGGGGASAYPGDPRSVRVVTFRDRGGH